MIESPLIANLPVLPVKRTVLFPGILMPLTVGRRRSVAAVEAALGFGGVVAAAAHDSRRSWVGGWGLGPGSRGSSPPAYSRRSDSVRRCSRVRPYRARAAARAWSARPGMAGETGRVRMVHTGS